MTTVSWSCVYLSSSERFTCLELGISLLTWQFLIISQLFRLLLPSFLWGPASLGRMQFSGFLQNGSFSPSSSEGQVDCSQIFTVGSPGGKSHNIVRPPIPGCLWCFFTLRGPRWASNISSVTVRVLLPWWGSFGSVSSRISDLVGWLRVFAFLSLQSWGSSLSYVLLSFRDARKAADFLICSVVRME